MNKKKVVITGGSGGIAQAIADKLHKMSDIYDVLTPNSKELDVTNIIAVNEYFRNKQIDILINNAGYILLEGIDKNNIDMHKKVLDINLTGTFICTGAVLFNNPHAKIINIGSSAASKPHENWSSYCAAKSAIVMATKCWAEEGVDSICISPGRTITKMRKEMYPNEDPNTLMKPQDFANIVIKAICGKHKKGINIDVNVHNVKELIDE